MRNLVETWLEEMLLPLLNSPSVLVMDNAAFYRTRPIKELLEAHGHKLLPWPPYSPDFNPMGQACAVLKKCREFAQPPPSIEDLLMCDFGFT
ncbi:transposase [Magnetococcus sp. PR-3]|uniref:transposase n=1 Tax=Magnetococcus sp. PR-3 TaxID=3120355 RepID=UPI003FA5EFF7